MKRTGLLETLAVALLACGFVGCVDVTDGTPPGSANVIAFSSPATSRAAVDAPADMSAFSVWGWYDINGTTGSEVFNAAEVSNLSGDAWNTSVTRYWIAGKTYNFYALHPSGLTSATCTPDGTLAVTNFDASKTGTDAIDLMTASAIGESYESRQGAAVPLSFNHELAKVAVTIQAQQGVNAEVNNVSLYGLYTTGTFQCGLGDVPSVEWDWGNGAVVDVDNTPYKNEASHALDGNSTTNKAEVLTLLVIPQNIEGVELRVVYKQDGVAQSPATLNLAQVNLNEWEAGCAYTYTLNISPNGITFSGTTVRRWEEDQTGGGDINIEY